MIQQKQLRKPSIDPQMDLICEQLASNKRVRRSLPGRGRVHVDRQLPFLFVYRKTAESNAGTEDFVRSEASHLFASEETNSSESVRVAVRRIVETQQKEFGAFLVVEVWAGSHGGPETDPRAPHVAPRFRILAPPNSSISPVVDTLASELSKIKILRQNVEVDVERVDDVAPPGSVPLLRKSDSEDLNCTIIGVEVPLVWHDPENDCDFPLLFRTLRKRLSHAFRRCVFEFATGHTTHRPSHYHALGRRAVVKAVWQVDEQLAKVSNAFDFLMQVTPINEQTAWKQFRKNRFEHMPDFHYLPTPIDPAALKRQLYNIPIERVEDPALHQLFQQKQQELDLKVTMLRDRNTTRFMYGSLQLYGTVADELYEVAENLLDATPPRTRDESGGGKLTANQFAERARMECDYYRQIDDRFTAKVEVTPKVAGIMVSRGRLLINPNMETPSARAQALLQHEVGTHLVTYFNGRIQPFRQLASGLAGYEELQEGLAVVAEYLVGGLSRPRIRQLAARVIAAKHLADGASFVETFRLLDRNFDFSQRSAFRITMRIYRGGGLTKDAVYLRGLRSMLRYLKQGGDLETLFVGKIATEHISIVKELRFREVLRSHPFQPRYMTDPKALARLDNLRKGMSVVDLVSASPKRNTDKLETAD